MGRWGFEQKIAKHSVQLPEGLWGFSSYLTCMPRINITLRFAFIRLPEYCNFCHCQQNAKEAEIEKVIAVAGRWFMFC